MDWSPSGITTALLSGNLFAIFITCTIAFSLPVLLHIFLYRSSPAKASRDFLLLGPSGSGKTALCSLLEQRSISRSSQKPPRRTHTSQVSSSITITLPPAVPIGSNKYRSVNDPTLLEATKNPTTYRLRDTPGHGKLRASQGIASLVSLSDPKRKGPVGIRGVIFMLDSATLSQSDEALRDAGTYLHDVLMTLQNRVYKNGARISSSSSTKVPKIPVLVAANKQDLFTALPPGSVKAKLESEIEKVRVSNRKGLLDVSMNSLSAEEEPDILGGNEEEGQFTFQMLDERMGIRVDVIGGAVVGDDEDHGSGVRRWEEWIGMCL
ncbi:conserved hypothetical protein [Histoplasma capsulatum G186AR]|uniref:Signal recognition particle receptor subunit beta n=2 Tax=Ajellomyces capsulatus TaxID=5037 RepID=C0NMD7_AJECG|nr:Signal recognition particle receptor subunit beta [Histoplasma capsulatum G186AR]EEH07788.1 conserved hypothetical protein [Histoplasma capsulatum G186AR]KAG5304065.1 SRP receptor beta subunit [Histoplasma capsulatum]QSS69663.1 SRP receptor beta subunit [Histoplasma capsulatum G186AR]